MEGRGVAYSMAYFSAKHMGTGQFYLMTIVDKAGKPLDGGSTYRLNVPANAPVKLYWSATAYDRPTHALIREAQWSSRSSNTPGLPEERRRIGGHLLWPQGPARARVQLGPHEGWRAIRSAFRLYGPEKPLFDKTWKLPDIEEVR